MKFMAKYRHAITAVIALLFIGCLIFFGVKVQRIKNGNVEADTFSGVAMGTAVKKTIYSESRARSEEVDKRIDEGLRELEMRISVRMEGAEAAACNKNHVADGLYELSGELLDYLNREMEIYNESNGAFSPCIRPLSVLWGIEDGKSEVPAAEQIEEALACTSVVNLELRDEGIVFHEENMAIDFGAVGKGIAGDKIMKILAEEGVQGGVISIGGSIAVYGNKGDGSDWHIGIQNPRDEEGKMLGVIDIKGSKMISTSGDYEKYFELDGKRYHHIFNPATGYPADSGLISVTIVSDSGFLSDALSTACFVMGLDEGMAYAEEKGVDAVFVTEDKEVYVTEGLKKSFHLRAKEYALKKYKK
ncbi:MAG: FAD:protein FMN transferase [Bacteroidales bacterium]|nr:FAD:protein FMN transferase [Clostridium sp.]MCM1202701.1 FAD:protein FMN transferase [Bacteroidales bacterium]